MLYVSQSFSFRPCGTRNLSLSVTFRLQIIGAECRDLRQTTSLKKAKRVLFPLSPNRIFWDTFLSSNLQNGCQLARYKMWFWKWSNTPFFTTCDNKEDRPKKDKNKKYIILKKYLGEVSHFGGNLTALCVKQCMTRSHYKIFCRLVSVSVTSLMKRVVELFNSRMNFRNISQKSVFHR